MAYGDQLAIICEMVDQLRSSGMEIICAGKGTKYLPVYHYSTPDKALKLHGYSEEVSKKGGLNPKIFDSFIDGTKSSIEMAAVANATGLQVPSDGLSFPPSGSTRLPQLLKDKKLGDF